MAWPKLGTTLIRDTPRNFSSLHLALLRKPGRDAGQLPFRYSLDSRYLLNPVEAGCPEKTDKVTENSSYRVSASGCPSVHRSSAQIRPEACPNTSEKAPFSSLTPIH